MAAIDGSEKAIELLRERAEARGLHIEAEVRDLTAAGFSLREDTYDLTLIAYYLQRNLFAKAKIGRAHV